MVFIVQSWASLDKLSKMTIHFNMDLRSSSQTQTYSELGYSTNNTPTFFMVIIQSDLQPVEWKE